LKHQTHHYVQCSIHTQLDHFQHPFSSEPNILYSQPHQTYAFLSES
jgi:hypothetical protein